MGCPVGPPFVDNLPFVVGFDADRAGQPQPRGRIWADPDDGSVEGELEREGGLRIFRSGNVIAVPSRRWACRRPDDAARARSCSGRIAERACHRWSVASSPTALSGSRGRAARPDTAVTSLRTRFAPRSSSVALSTSRCVQSTTTGRDSKSCGAERIEDRPDTIDGGFARSADPSQPEAEALGRRLVESCGATAQFLPLRQFKSREMTFDVGGHEE